MATIAQIRADLIGSSAVFRSEMAAGARQANQSLAQIRGDVKTTADSIVSLNAAAKGFIGFEVIKEGVSSLLEAQKAAQQIHYSLVSATGSAGGADAAYAKVEREADALGLALQSSALGFSQMSAAAGANGIAMKDQLALFDGLARSSTVLHLSSEQTGSAILALSQIFSKGKIQAQELQLQLGQAIPGVVPRFQQAVLEMTKGTNLAGKSFQQLLQDGDLTVQRFLPALITALRQTGNGAEQAAHGLNAEMNRLDTAWFKLKTDLSGGLFNDATTASIRFVAQNLEHLADVAGVTGGLIASRLVGSQLQRGAGGIERYQQQIQGAQMAAEAERAYALSLVATAEAQQEAAASDVALHTQRLQDAETEIAARQQTVFTAQAQRDAAQATLERQQTSATLSANIRAQQEASAALAKAESVLANEERMVTGALARRAEATELAAAANARLAETEATLIGLGGRVAATEQAIAVAAGEAGLAGMLAKAGKSFGSFALSLVGGPWGLAVAGIGALGYAIYDLDQRSEAYRQETSKQVESLKQMREQVQAAAKDYGTLHAAMGLQQSIDLLGTSSDEIAKKRKELADLIADRDAAQRASDNYTGGGLNSSALYVDQLNDRIKALEAEIGPAAAAVDELSQATRDRLTPSVNGLKSALDSLASGGGVSGFLDALPTQADIDAYVKSVDTARKNVESGLAGIATAGSSYAKKAATDGKTAVQVVQYDLDQVIKNIRAQHLAVDAEAKAIAAAQREAAPSLKAAGDYDAAEAAKKSAREAQTAARQQAQAYDTVVRSITERIAQDKEAAGSEDKLTAAERLRVQVLNDISSGHLKLSASQREYVDQLLKEAVAQGDAAKAAVEHQKQLEAMAVVQDNIARISQQISQQNADSLAGLSRGGQFAQDAAALRQIQRQYDDLVSQAGRQLAKHDITQGTYDKEVAQYKAALAEQLRAEDAYFKQRNALQADWKVGAERALDEYLTSASDVASQSAQLFSDAFSGLEDALVKFVQTGKLSFTDLANSIIADLVRMETRILVSQALQAIFGSYFGYDSSGGAGAASYNAMGGVTHVNFGGGRASGGAVAGGSLYEVAEGGKPEILTSGGRTYLMTGAQGGQVSPATGGGSMASGSGVRVVIENHTDVQPQVQQSTGPGGESIITVLMKQVDDRMTANAANPNSNFGRAMKQTYGLQRRGVPVSGG